MFKALFVVIALVLSAAPASAQSYIKPSTLAAQEALARLGYSVGTPDGVWGKLSREAMNAVRAENGLPPADDLTGSSIALLHRLSPGDDTLPHPGLFVTDAKARRTELQSKPALAASQCTFDPDDVAAFDTTAPVEVIAAIGATDRAITEDEDWDSVLLRGALDNEQSCLAGDDASCEAIVEFADKWASADALKSGVSPSAGAKFEAPRWIANIMLRDLTVAYGVARSFVAVDPLREARIVDWLKRRVDDYHSNLDDPHHGIDSPGSIAGQNHAVANMTAAMTFGILVGERSMVLPAIETAGKALQAIRKDGSIPAEIRRGSSWVHYTNLAIGQWLGVAEMAEAQGMTMDMGQPGDRASIPHAVGFLIDALADFDLAAKYSKENHAPMAADTDYTRPTLHGFAFGWLPSYIRRYGDDENMARLRSIDMDSRICDPEATANGKFDFTAACEGTSTPKFSKVLLGINPEGNHLMGYASGCLVATQTWADLLSPPVETTATYDGYQCRFGLVGLHDGKVTDTFASGTIKVAGDEAKFTSVKWSPGLQPKGEDLSGWPLTLTSKGQLKGSFPLFYLNNGQKQPDFKVQIDETNSPVFTEKPEGNVDFTIYEPDHWTGRLRLFACQK